MKKSTLKPVGKAHPCAVCEGDHKCSRGDDNLFMCGRVTGPIPGFVYMGQAKGDDQFSLYRREGDPVLENEPARRTPSTRRSGTAPQPAKPNGHATNGHAAVDWGARVEEHVRRLDAAARAQLAEALGLPEDALASLRIGKGQDDGGPYWSFPEVNGAGKPIGITRRYLDGTKKAMAGGGRGLTLPAGWDGFAADLPLLLPEGPSDVLACRALDLPAVGRPSNTGGVKLLAELLRPLPPERRPPLIVVGEYDPKPDGKWPGRDGAVKTAAALKAELGDGWAVSWSLPPGNVKDIRAHVVGLGLPHDVPDAWATAGDRLAAALIAQRQAPPPADGADAPDRSYRFVALDSATFFSTSYKLEWLVKRLLVRGQPCIFGGPKKSLKTTELIDLAVSLATATPFLGYFEVYRPCRVVLISGESGEATLQDTGRRICAARGVDPAAIDVFWCFRLPKIASVLERGALAAGLRQLQAAVVIIDPLYLCLLAGMNARDVEAGNLFQMGPLLLDLASACLDAGATPILAHHAKKNRADKEPLDLEDLSYSGFAEFARQWLLVSRRKPFDPETGSSRLWLSAGGSAGQSGLWAVDAEEGVLGDNFGGRKWEVTVTPASAQAEAAQHEAGRKRDEQAAARQRADDAALLLAIDRLAEQGRPATRRQVRDGTTLNSERFGKAAERLLAEGLVVEEEATVAIGNGAHRRATVLRRALSDGA